MKDSIAEKSLESKHEAKQRTEEAQNRVHEDTTHRTELGRGIEKVGNKISEAVHSSKRSGGNWTITIILKIGSFFFLLFYFFLNIIEEAKYAAEHKGLNIE